MKVLPTCENQAEVVFMSTIEKIKMNVNISYKMYDRLLREAIKK